MTNDKNHNTANTPANTPATSHDHDQTHEIGAWKILSSDYIIRRPWLTARRDKVQLPDGRVAPEFYVLEYPDWINIVALTTDGNIILERQWRHGLGEVSTEIPAGVVEAGETPLEAAKRELQEETGYTGGEWSAITTVAPNPGLMTNHCHCFLAKGVSKTSGQHLDANEDLQVFFRRPSEVNRMLHAGVFSQAMMVAPLALVLPQLLDE